MREAPSRTLLEALLDAGARVQAYDPAALDEARRLYPDNEGFTLHESAYEALEGADALAIVTEWQEFRSPDFGLLKNKLADGVVVDGRNLYDPRFMEQNGLRYYAIGRGRP
jgi:UDPglucose 6-dehydrogenase